MTEIKITDNRKQIGLVITSSLALFVSRLDSCIVNISIPVIKSDFNADTGLASMVVLFYFLASTSTLLLFGKLADKKGLRKLFIAGNIIFILGSLLCGLSPGIYFLISSRFLQGLGGSMLMATALAMISKFLPDDFLGKAFSTAVTVSTLGLFLGSPLGGFITTHSSWNWIFYINIPIGIIAIILALKYIPGETKKEVEIKHKFDYQGALLSLLFVSSIIFAIEYIDDYGLLSSRVLLFFATAVVLFFIFLYFEKKHSNPFLDINIFKSRTFTLLLFANMTAFMAYAGNYFLIPFYLQLNLKYLPDTAGIIMLMYPIAFIIFSYLAGKFTDKLNPNYFTGSSMMLATAAFFIFSFTLQTQALPGVIFFLFLVGMGGGLFLSTNNKLVMHHAPADTQGIVSSTLQTFSNLGSIIGVKLFETIYSSFDKMHTGVDITSYQYTYIVGGFITLVACLLSFSASIEGYKTKTEKFHYKHLIGWH